MTNEEHEIFMTKFNVINRSEHLIQSFNDYKSLFGETRVDDMMNHIEEELKILKEIIYED